MNDIHSSVLYSSSFNRAMQLHSTPGRLPPRYVGAIRLNGLLWALLLLCVLAARLVNDGSFTVRALGAGGVLVTLGAFSNFLLFCQALRDKQLRAAALYLLGFAPLFGILWWCWDKIAHIEKMSG
jgi:hypothetical protein